jgi:hypothetical protein
LRSILARRATALPLTAPSSAQSGRKSPPGTAARASLKFQRLKSRKNFWDAYRSFRDQFDLSKLAIEPEVFAGVRDKSPGREVNL